jgi:CPA2 family monovalent cation:H+ antiporter-2
LWAWLNSGVRQPPAAKARPDGGDGNLQHQAVVIGYGPVGQTVSRLLRENDIRPTIIEMNLETVKRLRRDGTNAVYGDASHLDTLKSAGVESAGSLILSASGTRNSEEVIRRARELNPDVQVLARSTYVHEVAALRKAGAEVVIAGEAEIALALTETILVRLGATPEQIDNERRRVRDELLGDSGPPKRHLNSPMRPDADEVPITPAPEETAPASTEAPDADAVQTPP